MAKIRMKIHQIMQTRRPLYEPVGACEPHITGTSRTAVIAACRAHIRASGGAPFTALLAHPNCGCTVVIPVTKSAIRKQRWSRDIADVLDTGTVCGNCYRAAADRVEAGRREVMQCLRDGQAISLLEAVELVTSDADLQLALYERVSQWRESPCPPRTPDLQLLQRRAEGAT